MSNALAAGVAFIFGALIGSFLNVCISRWPAGESVVHPRSRCPRCGRQIAWYDNVPMISWLLLRARCRSCGEPISALYPLVELTNALLWLAAFALFGPSFLALRLAVFASVLLGIAVTDARELTIPDGFTLFGLAWVLVTALLVYVAAGTPLGDTLYGAWLIADFAGPFASIGPALLGACVGAGAIAIIMWLGEVALKREAMGFGDVTLMAVVGAAVGPARALLTIFIGAVIALAVLPLLKAAGLPKSPGSSGTGHEESGHIPFGVSLAPAALIALLAGDALIRRYLEWMQL